MPSASIDQVRGTGKATTLRRNFPCRASSAGCSMTYRITTCVAERNGNENYSDAPPVEGQYVMATYSPNGLCSEPSANEIALLSNDKATLEAKIDGLVTGTGSAGHLGPQWGWYTLSPQWASAWPSSTNAASQYDGRRTTKIVVLTSDGGAQSEFDAGGLSVNFPGAGPSANAPSNQQYLILCDHMKASGIVLYAVGVGLSETDAEFEKLKSCASGPHMFYNAANELQLKQVFIDIALSLSSLHLGQ